ncbi:hypothetical protein D9756_010771 [Leucocoprinus leucothites]|uniref:Uncharacterized protein n=1 Tax=Leucocoprinus leucothites TaxID=201217 RepID=A0A8H5CUH5_9AGAR|nr:hypothetical protein D9756_010771 [Leucoagaricus leucothites]
MDYSHEQVIHDEVNLVRLVRRLEKSVASEKDWDDVAATQREKVWLQALGTLQKVKHGRKLLKNLEQYDSEPSPKKARQRTDLKTKLDRIELFMTEVRKRTEPTKQRPEPVLPRIPVPVIASPQPDSSPTPGPEGAAEAQGTEGSLSSTDDTNKEPLGLREQVGGGSSEALKSSTLSPPPHSSTLLSPVSSLLPATPTHDIPHSISSSTALPTSNATKRKHLQTTNSLHEDLSNQLAQMATQLKRNAQHFSDSLEKDKAVVEETQEKLEGNFATMVKERFRLRDFRVKSRKSTCLVMGIVLMVIMLFVIMVGAIRFSRR